MSLARDSGWSFASSRSSGGTPRRCRPLHALQSRGRGVLQGNVDVRADLFVRRDGLEQASSDLVGVRIEKTDPAQIRDVSEFLQQQGKSVFQAQVFAITSGVLTD